MTKRIIQVSLVFMLLAASFASAGGAKAWEQCPAYVTVQWGDTLGGLALLCDTTVDAIRAANPGLGWYLYTGQVLYMPTGYTPPSQPPTYYNTYTVQWGDTLGKIAARAGTSVGSLLAINPQISNASLIYTGQAINLPSGVVVPPPNYPTKPPAHPSWPPGAESFSLVKITYKGGLYIRNRPGGTEILSSAVNKTYWYYNTGNIQRLADGSVWVEVKLGEQIDTYWRGWMLVKDRLGAYFTSPKID